MPENLRGGAGLHGARPLLQQLLLALIYWREAGWTGPPSLLTSEPSVWQD